MKTGFSIQCSAFSLVSAVMLFTSGVVSAQTFTIDRFVLSGGGGTSTNGGFSLTGTIGQPDAGRMSGGPFKLDGGFQSVAIAIQMAGAPLLKIVRSGNTFLISWASDAAGYVLEEVSSLQAPATWLSVASPPVLVGQENQVTLPALPGARFYRLKRP